MMNPLNGGVAVDRLRAINWSAISVLALCVLISVFTAGFSVVIADAKFLLVAGLCSLLGIGSAVLLGNNQVTRWPKMMHAANLIAQSLVTGILFLILSYIAASANYPLQDELLQRAERLIPLDWATLISISNDPYIGRFLLVAYTLLQFLFLVPLLLCLAGQIQRGYELALILIVTLTFTVTLSMLVPAVGPHAAYGIDPGDFPNIVSLGTVGVEQMVRLRQGVIRELTLGTMTGVIVFPSFHAAAAIIFIWSLWAIPWLRTLGLLTGIAMLASTPVIGGHYFIDVLAGIALAGLAIVAVRRLSASLGSSATVQQSSSRSVVT